MLLRQKLILFFLAVLFGWNDGSASGAALQGGTLRMLTEDLRENIWSLNADRMLSSVNGSVLEAFGKVELRQGKDYLRADFARYFVQTNWVYLYGNVEVSLGGDIVNANEAELDMRSRTGWMTDGRIFMPDTNSHFQGGHIIRHRGNIYSFKDIKYSTCDGETPAWSFEAGEGSLETGGYAKLWGASFQLVDLPVFYTPYIVVPAKNERQSGFLLPDLGMNSRNGFFYTQPFFWAIDSSRDLTLYEGYMSRRGFMHGLAYRSKDSEDEDIWLAFDFIEDRTSELRDVDSEYYRGDGLIRPDKSRWWLRGMYDLRLPGEPLWRLRADLDYVSDQYYLRDFEHSMTGFTRSREDLFNVFSRDLREITENRESSIQLFREWERAGFYLSGTYIQNPALGNGDPVLGASLPKHSNDSTVQTLPELDFYLHQGRILRGLPLEAQAGVQASYLFRREGGSGLRLDLSPRLILPLSGRYGSIIASSRLRATWYSGERQDTFALTRENARNKREASRYVPDYEIKATGEFYRVYALDGENEAPGPGESSWTALRHSVMPRLVYRHTPQINQAGNPYYTEYDRLAPVHELVYSVDNVLTRKRAVRRGLPRNSGSDGTGNARTSGPQDENAAEDSSSAEDSIAYDYQDVVRLRLEQAYDLNEAGRGHDLYLHKREPWRDLLIELTLYAGNMVSLTGSSYYTPQENKFTRHSQTLGLSIPEWINFSSSLNMYEPVSDYYRQRLTRLTTLSLRGRLPDYGPWSADLYYEWPIKGTGGYQGKEEKGLILTYTHQCFSISGQIIRDDNDTTFKVQFALPGLSALGF